MPAIVVRKVDSPSDMRAFFELPWRVYADDPNWVPPLKSMRRELLSKEKHPAWEYMRGEYFTAWRGEQCVGSIAAFINQRHNDFQKEQVAWFGAFDVLDDAEAAHALLTTAEDWARAQGISVIRGPQTFTIHEDIGLLIDGFAPSVVLMPYHRPYYRGFIESAGYAQIEDMHSFRATWDTLRQGRMDERFEKMAAWLSKRGGIHVRPINRKKLRQEFALFKEIYNKAWTANWGFVPMTERELDALIEGLQLIFVPELACFAEVDGEPVGFCIAVPDFNQVLHRAYPRPGVPEPATLVGALWHWKLRPVINRARVPLMGVVQEHRSKGVDLAMYYQIFKALRGGTYVELDCGWISEKNHDMVGVLKGLGMEIHRTYRLYEKTLDG